MDTPMNPCQIHKGPVYGGVMRQELGRAKLLMRSRVCKWNRSLNRELNNVGRLVLRDPASSLQESKLLKVVITFVLLLPLLFLSRTSSVGAEDELDPNYKYIQALDKHPPDRFWIDLAHQVIDTLTLPKRFRIAWGLRSPSIPKGDIYFVLFDSEGVKELDGNPHARNCKYFSAYAIITCDASMFRLYAKKFGIDKKIDVVWGPNSTILRQSHTLRTREEQTYFYRAIMMWIIAHEFGHAFYRHSGTFSSLSESDLSDSSKARGIEILPESKDVLNRCHGYEQAADKYFVSLLASDKALSQVYDDLLVIINSAKESANCPNEPVGYTCEAVRGWDGVGVTLGPGIVTMNMSETHPALIVRVLDLLDRIAKQRRLPDNGFHKQVRDYRKMMLVKFPDESTGRRVCQIKDEKAHPSGGQIGRIPSAGGKTPQF